jgi:hypothetical protein
MQIMVSSPAWEMRQMAAVELRKRSNKWWAQIDQSTKDAIKKSLVEFTLAESECVVPILLQMHLNLGC